jgi:hypothetical protein
MGQDSVGYWEWRAELAERVIRETREREQRRQACGRAMHVGWIGRAGGQGGRGRGAGQGTDGEGAGSE